MRTFSASDAAPYPSGDASIDAAATRQESRLLPALLVLVVVIGVAVALVAAKLRSIRRSRPSGRRRRDLH